MPQGPTINMRVLLSGELCRTTESKRDLVLTLSRAALKRARKSPNQCAIANQAKMDTGKPFEVYRTVAYERTGKHCVRRYFVPEGSRTVETVNDISHKAAMGLVGYVVKLRHTAGTAHTAKVNRDKMRATKRAKSNGTFVAKRKNTLSRKRAKSLGQLLNLRERAAA